MTGKYEKVVFNKDMALKLADIINKISSLMEKEIPKLDLNNKEKIMATYYVAKAFYEAVQESVKEIGFTVISSKEETDALSCMTKVLDKIVESGEKDYGNLRDDIDLDKSSPSEISEFEKLKERMPDILFELCKNGKGKEIVEFMDKARPIFISESNRLGRILTKDEIFEICEDIKNGRR